MTKFLLIRHATNDTVGKIIAGRKPGVHLNEEGKLQAKNLAIRLASIGIVAVYSSPLARAVETAEAISTALHLTTEVNEDFIEINFGEWTGSTIDELRSEKEFHHFNILRSCTRIPGGETMLEAQARFISGLDKLKVKHPNEVVAIVSHGDLIKAAVAYYAGVHLDLFQRIEISPASVTIIRIGEEAIILDTVNNTEAIT